MAGTDRSRAVPGTSASPSGRAAQPPAIVLVEPQLGENIGMVARAMLNCGLTDLRLVRPREAWPSAKAVAAASGADAVLDAACLYETTAVAVADLTGVYATTARSRDMVKRVVSPRQAATEIRAQPAAGGRAGFLFGKEAKGLHNDDVAAADAILTMPLNPAFRSLNLAMAVLLVGYEWCMAGDEGPAAAPSRQPSQPPPLPIRKETRPATKAELFGLFEHLERELDACGFLRVAEKRPTMVRNLRTMLGRAELTEQEVRTLRGVIACLVSGRRSPT